MPFPVLALATQLVTVPFTGEVNPPPDWCEAGRARLVAEQAAPALQPGSFLVGNASMVGPPPLSGIPPRLLPMVTVALAWLAIAPPAMVASSVVRASRLVARQNRRMTEIPVISSAAVFEAIDA